MSAAAPVEPCLVRWFTLGHDVEPVDRLSSTIRPSFVCTLRLRPAPHKRGRHHDLHISISRTLRELQLLVRAGETVTDTQGRGRIETLSPSVLVISDRSGRHEWTDAGVAIIRQRQSDSLGNGALIGLAVGAGLGLAGGLATAEAGGDDAGWVAMATLVYGGLGASIGVGIDALIRRDSVIFHSATVRPQVTLLPMLTPTRQGIRLSVRF
jgi:hypothetical protein